MITSYSIHYTKVYDGAPRDPASLVDGDERAIFKTIGDGELFAIAGSVRKAKPKGAKRTLLVITSYSIHYTKLYDGAPGGILHRAVELSF